MTTTTARTQDLATASRVDIVQSILDLITTGDLQPGLITSERALGETLELGGRASVLREALALLARDGIVEPLPQKGYLIRGFSADEATEALELRTALERIVVERLAGLGLTDRLRFADEILSSMISKTSGDAVGFEDEGKAAEFAKSDRQFRCELARLGGFITGVYSIAGWSDQLRVFYKSNPLSSETMLRLASLSESLLQAIRRKDSAEAVSIVNREAELIKTHILQPISLERSLNAVSKVAPVQTNEETAKPLVVRTARASSFKRPVAAFAKRTSGRPRAKAAAAVSRKK